MVGFNYKFKTVADEKYGKVDSITGQWDGMIGEVARGVSCNILRLYYISPIIYITSCIYLHNLFLGS